MEGARRRPVRSRHDLSPVRDRPTPIFPFAYETRSLPKVIVVDNGPEFTSRALDEWAHRRGVQLQFIRPGKPVDNRLHRFPQREVPR